MEAPTIDQCERRRIDIYKDINNKLGVKVFWTVIGGTMTILACILGAQWGYSFNLDNDIDFLNQSIARQEGRTEAKENNQETIKTLAEIKSLLIKMNQNY